MSSQSSSVVGRVLTNFMVVHVTGIRWVMDDIWHCGYLDISEEAVQTVASSSEGYHSGVNNYIFGDPGYRPACALSFDSRRGSKPELVS